MDTDQIAIISDIHANIEALEVVMSHIADQGISRIYCLGDVIGYGPNPVECLSQALDWSVTLMGNHEEAVLNGPFGMNPLAKEAIEWTREVLEQNGSRDPAESQRWTFLEDLPLTYTEDDLLFVHASPRDPTLEYILRSDTEDLFGGVPEKIRSILELVTHVCFVGHTHAPGIITEDSQFLAPEDFGQRFTFEKDKRYICNVGSVGQPRDRNNKACYVTYDGGSLTYHRLEYPFGVTAEKIRENPRLLGPDSDNDRSAERLETGA